MGMLFRATVKHPSHCHPLDSTATVSGAARREVCLIFFHIFGRPGASELRAARAGMSVAHSHPIERLTAGGRSSAGAQGGPHGKGVENASRVATLRPGRTAVLVRPRACPGGQEHPLGRIVSVEANKFTMTATSGGKEHSHTLALDAKVFLDGKPCKLTDLKKDQFVRVTTKEGDPTMAVRVEAFTTKPPIKGQPDRLPPPPRP